MAPQCSGLFAICLAKSPPTLLGAYRLLFASTTAKKVDRIDQSPTLNPIECSPKPERPCLPCYLVAPPSFISSLSLTHYSSTTARYNPYPTKTFSSHISAYLINFNHVDCLFPPPSPPLTGLLGSPSYTPPSPSHHHHYLSPTTSASTRRPLTRPSSPLVPHCRHWITSTTPRIHLFHNTILRCSTDGQASQLHRCRQHFLRGRTPLFQRSKFKYHGDQYNCSFLTGSGAGFAQSCAIEGLQLPLSLLCPPPSLPVIPFSLYKITNGLFMIFSGCSWPS